MKSRARGAVPPFAPHDFVGLSGRSLCLSSERFRREQLRQRPHRRAAHQRAGVIEQSLRLDSQRGIAGVADRDQHVAHEAVAADALDRGFCEQRAEGGIVEPCEFGERRLAQLSARGQFCLAADLRELVPGADGEAIVAAIDAVADRFAEFARDRSLVLDGQIRDAAPRIELVGRGERRGRADLLAGIAGAAMIDVGVRRAAGRSRRRSRRGTATSRTRARRDWCACPASRGRRPAPAAFPSPRRCRRTLSPRRRWSRRASAPASSAAS